jgi:hypothetical protein
MLLQTAGCGSGVSGDTWLIAAGGDSVSVSEVGAAWNRMNDENRDVFTARDNPLGQYLLAYARKMMVEMEIESHGFLSCPALLSQGEAWLRFTAGTEALDSLRSRERGLITEDEVRFFLDHAGTLVWYTICPGGPGEEVRGPEHLPEILPPALAFHLDSMSVGQILPDAAGIPVRLDSVLPGDPAILEPTLADTAASREMAIESMMLARSAARVQEILDGMHAEYSVRVDTAAVERLAASYRGECELRDEPLLTSDLESWTSQELSDELAYLSSRMVTRPSSGSWLLYCLDHLLLQSALAEQEGISGDRLDSLEADAEAYMLSLASDWLYDEVVSSTVTVTEEDIRYQFDFLTEPVMLPERRVLRAALLPSQRSEDYRAAAEAGTLDGFRDELGGVPGIAAAPAEDPQRTRPLTISEVPGGYGESVFNGSGTDSSGWMGPFQLGNSGDFILFRVEEILPASAAGLEDLRRQVEEAARSRLEEEVTVRWMHELEEKYSLEINEDALDRLPADPALWCNL